MFVLGDATWPGSQACGLQRRPGPGQAAMSGPCGRGVERLMGLWGNTIRFPFRQHKLYHFLLPVPLKMRFALVWKIPSPQQVNKRQLK